MNSTFWCYDCDQWFFAGNVDDCYVAGHRIAEELAVGKPISTSSALLMKIRRTPYPLHLWTPMA